MISKDKTWNLILEGLKDIQSSNKITDAVMSKIKELDSKNAKSKNKCWSSDDCRHCFTVGYWRFDY